MLKAKRLKGEVDNGREKLHQTRFDLRMPISLPKQYWHRMPAKRELFRHFPLAHLGMEGQVSETTVLRMQDRRVPVSLGKLYKANAARDSRAESQVWVEPTEVRHLQEAVLNYAVILNALWPLDYAGFMIMWVLVEAKWGEVVGENEKERVALVKKFFDDTVKDNSGRAVRDEPPLDYEEVKTKWVRALENLFPGWMMVSVASSLSVVGKGKQQQQQGAGGGQGRGGANSKGRGGQGGKGGRGGGSAGSGDREKVTLNGLAVCFGFNCTSGCTRDSPKPNVCKDGNGNHYAHACNYMDKQTTGKFCLQLHPRHRNH